MRWLAALLIAACLTGCDPEGYVKVPRLPAWQDSGVTYTQQEVKEYILVHAGVFPNLSDATYTAMTDEWVDRILKWTWHFSHATGIAYTKDSFDCDKFAKAVSLAAEIACARAGIEAQPLVARVYVRQIKEFGGIPAGGTHAVNAVLTESGVWIIEPQTRRKVQLEHYPNRQNIYYVSIGG